MMFTVTHTILEYVTKMGWDLGETKLCDYFVSDTFDPTLHTAHIITLRHVGYEHISTPPTSI